MEYRKYGIWLCCMLLLAANTANAQNSLRFKRLVHDFGEIKEDGGKVTTSFAFENKGNKEVTVTNIAVSCGCTTPSYPEEAIAPGDTGRIVVTFDPMDRPGKFEKNVGVETDNTPRLILKIKGDVEPRPKGPRDWYPFHTGNLWWKQSSMFVGSVYKDSTVVFDNVVYNASDEPITIEWEKADLPGEFISLLYSEAQGPIAPGDSAKFELHYIASKKDDWGYTVDTLRLPTNDAESPTKLLYAGAILKERFNPEDPQAHYDIDKKEHAFGKIGFGKEKTASFTLKNTGAAPLFIRKASSNCDCISVDFPYTGIAPGKEAVLEVTLDTGENMGWMRKVVTLITNDPDQDFKNLIIKADVMPPKSGD